MPFAKKNDSRTVAIKFCKASDYFQNSAATSANGSSTSVGSILSSLSSASGLSSQRKNDLENHADQLHSV